MDDLDAQVLGLPPAAQAKLGALQEQRTLIFARSHLLDDKRRDAVRELNMRQHELETIEAAGRGRQRSSSAPR